MRDFNFSLHEKDQLLLLNYETLNLNDMYLISNPI